MNHQEAVELQKEYNDMILSLDESIRALQERREALYERFCELKDEIRQKKEA